MASDFDASTVGGATRHGETAAQRGLRWMRHLVGSSAEDRAVQLAARGTRRPVTTGRRIAVCGVGGGGGTTTLALLLGTVYAVRRSDQVLAVDTDPDASLSWRLAVSDQPVPADLTGVLAGGVPSPADLDALPRTPHGLWVLPAGAAGPSHVLAMSAAVSRFFGISIVDCVSALEDWAYGRGDLGPRTAAAHATVLTAPATLDGVRRTRLTLDRLAAQGGPGALHRCVVVLVAHNSAVEGLRVKPALAAVGSSGAAAFFLPYDRHLASSGPVVPSRVRQATLLAATTVGAEALSRALIP